MMLLILLVGALLGGWLGQILVHFVPALGNLGSSTSVGIPRFSLDLGVIALSFGLTIKLNLFSLLGMVGAFFVYRQM